MFLKGQDLSTIWKKLQRGKFCLFVHWTWSIACGLSRVQNGICLKNVTRQYFHLFIKRGVLLLFDARIDFPRCLIYCMKWPNISATPTICNGYNIQLLNHGKKRVNQNTTATPKQTCYTLIPPRLIHLLFVLGLLIFIRSIKVFRGLFSIRQTKRHWITRVTFLFFFKVKWTEFLRWGETSL